MSKSIVQTKYNTVTHYGEIRYDGVVVGTFTYDHLLGWWTITMKSGVKDHVASRMAVQDWAVKHPPA